MHQQGQQLCAKTCCPLVRQQTLRCPGTKPSKNETLDSMRHSEMHLAKDVDN